VIAGLAVAAAGVAVGLDIAASHEKDGAQDVSRRLDTQADAAGLPRSSICYVQPTRPDCTTLENTYQRWGNEARWRNALYAGAAGLAVAGVAIFVWPRRRTTASAWLSPQFVEHGAGLAVGGRF
jgi:hypothetical protein